VRISEFQRDSRTGVLAIRSSPDPGSETSTGWRAVSGAGGGDRQRYLYTQKYGGDHGGAIWRQAPPWVKGTERLEGAEKIQHVVTNTRKSTAEIIAEPFGVRLRRESRVTERLEGAEEIQQILFLLRGQRLVVLDDLMRFGAGTIVLEHRLYEVAGAAVVEEVELIADAP